METKPEVTHRRIVQGKGRLCLLNAISFGMLLALGAIQPVQANIVADKSAPENLQPNVTQHRNPWGDTTAQVDIQKPSAAGVSRNVYSQFDVDRQGVVLNNSRTGDWEMAGNPNLAQGEARVILNEVNSHNPSQLNGIISVAGQRAEVVIANPAGITCNGCGFSNVSRGVLTTGEAQITDGVLTGYKVDGGKVSVEGNGFYSAGEYTDIIARAVKINGSVNANNLGITTGRNLVDAENRVVSKLAEDGSSKPELALDVSSLGSIYSNKIRMIGTERGVGVSNVGVINAYSYDDDVTINADGEIGNSGEIFSYGKVQLAGQEIRNDGTIHSVRGMTLAGQNVRNYGDISDESNTFEGITVKSDHFENRGFVTNGWSSINIESDTVDNQNGSITAGDVSVTASSINNTSGRIAGRSGNGVRLQTTTLKNTQGAISAENGDITIGSDSVDNQQGSISGSSVSLNTTHLNNNGGSIASRFNGYGGGKVAINSDSIDNQQGTIAGHDVSLQTASLNNKDGLIEASNDLNLNIANGVDPQGTLISAGKIIRWQEKDDSGNGNTDEDAGAGNDSDNGNTGEEAGAGNDSGNSGVDGVLPAPDKYGLVGVTDAGVPIRDITWFRNDAEEWDKNSGFTRAMDRLILTGELKRLPRWSASGSDLLTYLYLTFASGTKVTDEMLNSIRDDRYGWVKASEKEWQVENIKVFTDLMERCWAGNCK